MALASLGKIIATQNVNWISDADIKGFFDNICHSKLCELLRQRIADPRMLPLIERFLKTGVMIEGRREETDDGVARGAVLVPLLANVYLHYVLDLWFERDVKPRLRGETYLIRCADDFICAFECETDARCFQEVLMKRLERFSLELALEKSKLLRFGRFAERDSARLGEGRPGVFDFLGFTHYCGLSRAGRSKLKRRTSKKKLTGKLRDVKDWLRSQLTVPLREVWPHSGITPVLSGGAFRALPQKATDQVIPLATHNLSSGWNGSSELFAAAVACGLPLNESLATA